MMAEQETHQDGKLASLSELCVICFEPFTNPKMLQCGHSFCEECLQGYHKVNQQAHNAQPGKLPCPTCRELTSIPENGISGLRNDFKARKLEEVFRMMTVRNRTSSCVCDPCTSAKITADASVYCSKCKVNYCNGCLLKHDKNPIFKDHKLFEKSLQENLATELICKVHKGEDGRYFCQTCKVVACTLCIIREHSEHPIAELDEFYVQQQQDMRNLQQIIDSKVERQQIKKAVLDSERTLILSSRKEIEYAIEEKASQMIETIQKQEAELLRELRQKTETKLKVLEEELEIVDFYIAKAHSLQEYTRPMGKLHLIQMMTAKNELIQRMHTIAEADESTYCEEQTLDLTFLAAKQDLTIGNVAVKSQQKVTRNRPPDNPSENARVDGPSAAVSPAASWNVILVSGIKNTTDKDTLKEFFECKRRSGGGPVDNIDYRKDKGEAVVTFFSEEDAQRVLQHGYMELEGANITTTKVHIEESTQNREYMSAPRGAITGMPVHILEIRGIKPGTPRQLVEMFIENKSEVSELQSFQYESTTGVTIVAFKDAQDAAKMMSFDKLELEGARLSVTPLSDSYDGLDRESCRPRGIKLEGIGKVTSNEILALFFEIRRRSGGGDIEQFDYDDDEGIAVIIFNDANSASQVVQKEPLIFNNTRLEVKLMTPPKYMPVVPGPFEENLVLVSGLSPMCTDEDLKAFFTAQDTHSAIQHVTFSLKQGIAMLQFTHPPEFDRLRELCVTKPFRGTMLSVQRVPQSQTIQVHNISCITEDMFIMYFENKRSGGGQVTNVHVRHQDECALIEFAESDNVRDVLAKDSHNVMNRDLHVRMYYECLGLIPPHHNNTMSVGSISKQVNVTGLCPRLLKFLQTSAVSRKLVNAKMAEEAAVVKWETYNATSNSIELTCTISHNTKNVQAMAKWKTWSQTLSKNFLGVLVNNFVSRQVEAVDESWEPPCIDMYDGQDEIAYTACITGQKTKIDSCFPSTGCIPMYYIQKRTDFGFGVHVDKRAIATMHIQKIKHYYCH